MDVKIEHKQKMVLIGFSSHIAPDEGYEKCPEFWDKEYNARFAHLWQTGKLENPVECAVLANRIGMFAICSCTKNGFDYWIAGIYQGGDVPDGLKLFTFQESDWAIFFSAKGPIPSSIQNLNAQVWKEWYPTEGVRLGANTESNMEFYSAGNPSDPNYECGIWIPLSGKTQL